MNRLITIIGLLVGLSCLPPRAWAQENVPTTLKSISFTPQFFQFKESYNYGLVYSGLNLGVAYSMTKTTNTRTLAFTPELGFGANFNKGVGMAWTFQPIDFFYGYRINTSEKRALTLGPYLATNYQWQLYPFLQSGHLFWFTSLEVGPQLMLTLPLRNKLFRITFSNSLAGWSSRPAFSPETYFYTLKISDFISNAHRDLKFGINNLFNHTQLEIERVTETSKRLQLSYGFEYFGYYQTPKIYYLSHSLNLKWKIGKP